LIDLHYYQITITNYELTPRRWYAVCVRTWQITNDWSSTLKIIASTHYLEVYTTMSTGVSCISLKHRRSQDFRP